MYLNYRIDNVSVLFPHKFSTSNDHSFSVFDERLPFAHFLLSTQSELLSKCLYNLFIIPTVF